MTATTATKPRKSPFRTSTATSRKAQPMATRVNTDADKRYVSSQAPPRPLRTNS